MERAQNPSALIVFGATGDLTQNKLYPALYKLAEKNVLPKQFYLYGVAHEIMTKEEFLGDIKNDLKRHFGSQYSDKIAQKVIRKVRYISGDLTEKAAYDEIEAAIQKDEKRTKRAILRLFYLALPPVLFGKVVSNVQTCKLGKHLCTLQHVLSRVIIEKPFGYDYKTAVDLDKKVRAAFDERQIYRIDHYLGKESINNILAFRFANPFIKDVWNNKHIKEIHINALETVGLEGRYKYYDGSGALRDMVQNHLFQFLAYLTMNEPQELSTRYLRKEKERIFKNLKGYTQGCPMITGQYKGYKQEPGIPRSSNTETYTALKVRIDVPEWKNVPIYIRTGKNLSRKDTSATILFKQQNKLFHEKCPGMSDNLVNINISPAPSIEFKINVQKPDFKLEVEPATLRYCPAETKKGKTIGDYERLLLYVFEGNQLLFTSSKEVIDCWKAIDPFLKKAKRTKPFTYQPGTLGPKEAHTFMQKHKTKWYDSASTCAIN